MCTISQARRWIATGKVEAIFAVKYWSQGRAQEDNKHRSVALSLRDSAAWDSRLTREQVIRWPVKERLEMVEDWHSAISISH